MRLYLSSYKYGDHIEYLKNFYKDSKKVALILNAQDTPFFLELRDQKVKEDKNDWESFGFECEEIDLREYFDQQEKLEKKMSQFDGVWVRGGNTFALLSAMKKSGFDVIVKNRIADDSIIYGGYSAGVCVLGNSLKGLEICDEIESVQKMYGPVNWEGMSIFNYTFVPHFESDHPEAGCIKETVKYLHKHNIDYKTLKDGQVFVVDGDRQELLT